MNQGNLGWAVLTLTYIEGQSANDAITSTVKAAIGAVQPVPEITGTAAVQNNTLSHLYARVTPNNTQAFEFAGFLCPSGPRATQINSNNNTGLPAGYTAGPVGRLSYKACIGGNSIQNLATNAWMYASLNQNADGSFSYLRGANFADLTDGTSNVVTIGEVAMTFTQPGKYIGSVANRVPQNGANANDPCTGGYNTTTKLLVTPFNGAAAGLQSFTWAGGNPLFSSFSTAYPPNGPSCAGLTNVNASAGNHNNTAVISASSYHPGGCQAALGDGSVRFWSETMDQLTWRRIGDKADGQPVTISE
jgi:hypothetical protein